LYSHSKEIAHGIARDALLVRRGEQHAPGPVRLQATGEVKTPSAHQVPKLARAVPQGINPKILILNLTVEETGKGGAEVEDFRRADYEEECKAEQFTEVQINCEGSVLQMIKVDRVF
jgi:hypothetical protein